MRYRAQVPTVLAALALGACGEEETGGEARVLPDDPAATGTAPPPASTPTAREPQSEPLAGGADRSGGGEDVPGGGGDANALVPAVYDLATDAVLSPPTVGVPEFLGIRLEVRSSDDEAHRVELRVDPPVQLTVPPRGSASVDVMGQREGRYAVTVDGERAGTLEVGVEPGP
ncbi:MAG TPA: hypothetical protein VGW11_06220 [Solirubrobacteraceae bacterium]|nr:hypothetical protein [Solirubrobacteraceae bacterium]